MKLIGNGRDGEVFDLGNGTVLRRFQNGRSQESEAKLIRHVRASGFPVPEVVSADGSDMEMDKIDGPTMLNDATTHPWRLRTHARAGRAGGPRLDHSSQLSSRQRHHVCPGPRIDRLAQRRRPAATDRPQHSPLRADQVPLHHRRGGQPGIWINMDDPTDGPSRGPLIEGQSHNHR